MAKTTGTVTVTYRGGPDEVVVAFPSGDMRRVARGGSIDVLATDAAHLSREEWDGTGVGTVFDDPDVPVTPSPEADK